MKIYDWPAGERPRERLLLRGASVLSDAELVALFIGQGLPGCNAVDLARRWLHQTGGLDQLLSMEQKAFTELAGAGNARFVLLQAALEIGRRYLEIELARTSVLDSPATVERYLKSQLKGAVREHFGCLFLDNQHRVIEWTVLFSGTLNAAAVYPREVVRTALIKGAAAVILAHNHPSGIAEPSMADQQITDRLVKALALVDIRVLDHLIIGDGLAVSFAERGLLS